MEETIQDGRAIKIALAGNPNSGKTTLFNALTGAHHKVGNYPGVTVEKREGIVRRGDKSYRIIDLPGVYSLTAYSMDEVVARDFLLDERPDVIIDVLDSTNLDRNLYLCLQFQELGIPVVGALNMSDEARAKGIDIDAKTLGSVLGLPMAKTVGPKGSGVDELLDLVDAMAQGGGSGKTIRYGTEIEEHLEALQAMLSADPGFAGRYPPRWLAVKLLEKDENADLRLAGHPQAAAVRERVLQAISWIERHFAKDSEIVISEQRYGYIRGATKEAVRLAAKPNFSLTEAVDKVVMNRFLALPIFVFVLWGVFKLTFTLGEYPMGWLEGFFGWVSGLLSGALPDGFLKSLLVDGIIAGVGGVFSFVPLIIILFFLLSILEDLGYMSRAAFATDKILHAFGLHGQSIFPMMLGFGCSVPAIMGARTLKSRRDRIVTILVIPFMSCGAKLPVHVLFAAAFFPDHASEMVMLVYAVGVLLSLLSALVLRKTVLRGDATPFVMELPPYRAPTLRGILWHVWEKTWYYVKKAGTVILAASLLIWAVTSFPQRQIPQEALEGGLAEYRARMGDVDGAAEQAYADALRSEYALEHSAAGTVGKVVEPIFRPLGFSWKFAVATLTGFAAKEVVVSTLGILYSVGSDEEAEGDGLQAALRDQAGLSPLLAFAFMLFTLVIPPCFAALATIKAELGWRWMGFAFGFMFVFGWLLSFLTVQLGRLFGIG